MGQIEWYRRNAHNPYGQQYGHNDKDMVAVDFVIGNTHKELKKAKERSYEENNDHQWTMFVRTANPQQDGDA